MTTNDILNLIDMACVLVSGFVIGSTWTNRVHKKAAREESIKESQSSGARHKR